MQDELEKLEIILTDLSNTVIEKKLPDYKQWRSIIQAETDRIKRAFIKQAFGLRKEKLVELYIQYHQSNIVQLIDRVLEHLTPEDVDEIHSLSPQESQINLLKILYHNLEQLLAYIEKHFSKYFNLDAKSPERYRFIVHRELQEKLPEIRYVFEKKQVNKRLLTIVLTPLYNFVDAIKKEEASYKKIIYLKELLTELEELTRTSLTGERLDFKLCLCLGYLNYNSHKFFKFCAGEIIRIVQDQESLSSQIEKLAYMLKVINQIQAKPGFIYNDKLCAIKDQLSDWVAQEIYYFEKRQQLTINFPSSTDEPIQKDFKLKLNVSVAQLAYLLRALKDIGIIKNNNVLEVIRFIAGIVQTKHTENISWDSLRTKFYNVEDSAREGVKDIALSLFNFARKPGK